MKVQRFQREQDTGVKDFEEVAPIEDVRVLNADVVVQTSSDRMPRGPAHGANEDDAQRLPSGPGTTGFRDGVVELVRELQARAQNDGMRDASKEQLHSLSFIFSHAPTGIKFDVIILVEDDTMTMDSSPHARLDDYLETAEEHAKLGLEKLNDQAAARDSSTGSVKYALKEWADRY